MQDSQAGNAGHDAETQTAAAPLPGSEPAPGARRLVRCGLCGRPLIGKASRRTGLGPACDARLHPPGPDIRARRREADQDPIPGC